LDAWGAARRNRGTAFLNADVELTTVGFTPEQIGLNAAREIIATELARAVGIPAYFIDAPTGSSMTYQNAQTARQTLLDFSLLPLMNSISPQDLSMPDFTPSTQRVEFDLKAYLRGSEKERAEIYKILFDIGAITTDEIRQMEDMIQ
jgi:HK97 family phage portal protein